MFFIKNTTARTEQDITLNNELIPYELIKAIAMYLPTPQLGLFAQSCRGFFKIAQDVSLSRKYVNPIPSQKISFDSQAINFCTKDNTAYRQLFKAASPYKNGVWGHLNVMSMHISGDQFISLVDSNHGKGTVTTSYDTFSADDDFNDEELLSVYTMRDSYLVLTATGNVYSWGENRFGQLGLGDTVEYSRPQKINFEHVKIKAISVGILHVLALSQDGYLYAWGSNEDGQLGLGKDYTEPFYDSPQEVSFFNDMTINAIYSSTFENFVIADNKLYFFGLETQRRPNYSQKKYYQPQELELFKNHSVAMLALDSEFALALTSNGKLLTWDKDTGIKPQKFQFLKDKRIVAVFAAEYHYVVLTSDKEIYLGKYKVGGPQKAPTLLGKESMQLLKESMLLATENIRNYALQRSLANNPLSTTISTTSSSCSIS